MIDPDEIIVQKANLDQYLKGNRIDQIGRSTQLGEDTQKELNMRAEIDDEGDHDPDDDDAALQ